MKTHPAWLLPAEMHEDATEVLRVLLDPHVLSSWRVLLEEAKHVLLELARPLARDDLDQRRLLRLGLVEDAVQVERQLHLPRLFRWIPVRPDRGDNPRGGLRGVVRGEDRLDPLVGCGRLEGGKLAVEQLLREEVVGPR